MLCLLLLCTSVINPVEIYAAEVNDTVEQENSTEQSEAAEYPAEEAQPGIEMQPTAEDQFDSEVEPNTKGQIDSGEQLETEGMAGTQTQSDAEPLLSSEAQHNAEEQVGQQWNFTDIDLTLQYDDRYSFADIREGWKIVSIETKEVVSSQVSGGKNTAMPDTDIVLTDQESDTDIIAVGVGQAEILLVSDEQVDQARSLLSEDVAGHVGDETIEAIRVNVTVEPAKLTLMYVAGQSNAEGWCSANTGYRQSESVACQSGTVYSTYVPSNDISKSIIGISFSNYCTADNASDFVAGALRGSESISGRKLEYELDTLTEAGRGKTGPDSGLAYEWNQLTGDKVWVINTAWGGSAISSWIPGEKNYERSKAVYMSVQKTYEAEIAAGHYLPGDTLLFWLQGESNKNTTADSYGESLETVYNAMRQDFSLDGFGMIMVRSDAGNRTNAEDISMSGPRIAQYVMGNRREFSKAYVVSNVNEQWISDAGVEEYFQTAYPEGYLTYPMHGAFVKLPVTVSAIHSDIHYSQIAHNENGLTAADGMYAALYAPKSAKEAEISWRNGVGKKVTRITLDWGDEEILVPVTNPLYDAKEVYYSTKGSAASYDEATGALTWKRTGSFTISACDAHGHEISTVIVTATDTTNMSSIAGANYNGLFPYNGAWWYLENGHIQKKYEGVVHNENGWWYVKNGKVDFTYNGFAQNSNGWWYIENGKVTFQKNDVIKGTVNGTNAWWYVKGSKVTFTDTVAQNSNGWWRIENGKVNFDYTGVEKNENGWWYIESGKVNFGYNGFAQNSNGWWYIENGEVTFQKNDVIYGTVNGEKAWWYVKGSKVTFAETVAQNSNGWWRIENGKVNFDYTGVEKNENGWWYIEGGKVNFGYNGFARNSNGWWYIENGKVTFRKNDVIYGTVNETAAWWYVKGSKVTFTDTVAQNSNGWWRIENGKVDFGYNGAARNENGWWYIRNGKVDFSYNGTLQNGRQTWYFANGKLNQII